MNKEEIRARINEVEAEYDKEEGRVGPKGETPKMKTLLAEMGTLYKKLGKLNQVG